MTKWVVIDPHDASIFRDGRSFNQNDDGMSIAVSQFPPSPRALAMAVRVALARGNGWEGGNWNQNNGSNGESFAKILGNGPDKLGELKFSASMLFDFGSKEALYPAPLSLVSKFNDDQTEIEEIEYLRPGEVIDTDLGKAKLPAAPKGGGWKTLDSWFVKASGLGAFLGGNLPEKSTFVHKSQIMTTETRIGIGRDYEKRTANDGEIFSASLGRLGSNLERATRYGFLVGYDGAEDWSIASCQPIGGESRFAWFEKVELSFPENEPGGNNYFVMLTSPMRPSCDGWCTPQGQLENLPGKIISACVGKPVMFGGWSSVGVTFGPLPLKSYLPAGSVFFMENDKALCNDDNELPKAIGEHTDFGFGGCVYGKWEN